MIFYWHFVYLWICGYFNDTFDQFLVLMWSIYKIIDRNLVGVLPIQRQPFLRTLWFALNWLLFCMLMLWYIIVEHEHVGRGSGTATRNHKQLGSDRTEARLRKILSSFLFSLKGSEHIPTSTENYMLHSVVLLMTFSFTLLHNVLFCSLVSFLYDHVVLTFHKYDQHQLH